MINYKLDRQNFIRGDFKLHHKDDFGTEVHIDISGKSINAVGFSGRRQKPDFNYIFGTEEKAFKYIDKWLVCLENSREAKKKRSIIHQNECKIGDVLSASWGYEQTNINYYEVVGLRGARTLVLREIAKRNLASTGMDSGICEPMPNHYIGEEFSRRVASWGNSVNVDSTIHASLKKCRILPNGDREFDSDEWSSGH